MEIDTFREMVEKSGSIVFFGGAGAAPESMDKRPGIPIRRRLCSAIAFLWSIRRS